MRSAKTFEYYENTHNKNFPNNLIKILSREKNYFYFQTEYGLCKKSIKSINTSKFNLQSAVNKTEYLKNKIYKLYGNKFDFSLVKCNKGTGQKATLICKKHGEFSVRITEISYGKASCMKCSKISTSKKLTYSKKQFIEKANKIHKNKYDYTFVNYLKGKDKVIICCPIHKKFYQVASHHLEGHGCQKCANIIKSETPKNTGGWTMSKWKILGEKSKNFDSFKVYIIKCWNEDEEFYKIGRTFKKVEKRFHSNVLPYQYKVIHIIQGSAEIMHKLETKLKSQNKEHKYVPLIEFGGMYECFTHIKDWTKYLNK